jgi:hypothetical protein
LPAARDQELKENTTNENKEKKTHQIQSKIGVITCFKYIDRQRGKTQHNE